jgi:hypothetical protein
MRYDPDEFGEDDPYEDEDTDDPAEHFHGRV